MKVKVTAKFFFDNGESRSVDWIIDEPTLTYGTVKTVLTSPKEVQDEFQKLFRKLHTDESLFTVNDIKDESCGIPFKKVSFWTLKAEEVIKATEGNRVATWDRIPPLPSPPPRIGNH